MSAKKKTSTDLQIEEWVEGRSAHNLDRDECCPDFSCCTPELQASEAERRTFARYWREGNSMAMNEMLMMFLGKLIHQSGLEEEVHIAGQVDDGRKN
jgi:hypothetical protein